MNALTAVSAYPGEGKREEDSVKRVKTPGKRRAAFARSWSCDGPGGREAGQAGEAARPMRLGEREPGGDPVTALAASFEDFFELEHESLFGALYLLTGNRSDAEDLMQLAFMKVWERWSWVQEMDNPTGYLYRTALNTFRSQRRRAVVAARGAVRQVIGRRGGRPADRIDVRDEVDRALATLTPRQREAVVLVDLLEFPADEAARLLGIAPSTLRVQLARGRERARGRVGRCGWLTCRRRCAAVATRSGPTPGAFERLVRRRVRRRRTQRAVSAAVALLLAAVAAWELGQAFTRPRPRPGGLPITRKNVSRLHLAWSGGSAGAVGMAPVISRHEMYATGFSLQAYPRSCATETCGPVWVGNRDGRARRSPTWPWAGASSSPPSTDVEGTRKAARGREPPASRPGCRAALGLSPSSSVVVAGGVVYAQGHQIMEAFPERCSLTCRPLWRAPLRAYGGQLVAVGGGLVFVQDQSTLKVFRSSCRSDGGLCSPFGKRPTRPLGRDRSTRMAVSTSRVASTKWWPIGLDVTGETIVVRRPYGTCPTRSALRFRVGVCTWQRANPSLCSIRPVRPGLVARHCGGRPISQAEPSVPTVARGLVFFTVGDMVYAVPEACGSGGAVCSPVWQERVQGGRAASCRRRR